MRLEDHSIIAWIVNNGIKTEDGSPFDLKSHLFMYDILCDFSPKQVGLKAAQIGWSTMAILKVFWVAKKMGIDCIYTLPTATDVNQFAGGKINRLIAQNPVLSQWVKDKDTVEQKTVGDNIVYFRGSFTQKAAMMVPSDLNIHDELDASDQRVIEQYATRLQHSDKKWEWFFSHPSAEGVGVSKLWEKSDKKHWFVQCKACEKWQYLDWPASICTRRQCYQCIYCKEALSDETRRTGKWVKKHKNAEYSGYWVPLLICPWVPAKEIIWYYENKSEEYFYNKVLGLPYVGGDNKLAWKYFAQNLTDALLQDDDRVVIGVDPGKKIHYVCGNPKGLFYHGECTSYDEIRALLKRWPKSIAVIDQGGDLIGPRELRDEYPGRVYLCTYKESEGKTLQLVKWGAKDEQGHVVADRNRMIQLVVDEFTDKRIPVEGTEEDWAGYFAHWNSLTRVVEENERGIIKKRWVRSGDDHWCFVAGTKIQTKQGEKNIEDLRVGDLVLTRVGFRPVACTMSREAEVIETPKLTGTGDHPIWTENKGWTPLHAMQYCDTIKTCKKRKLRLMVLSIADTLLRKTGQTASISHHLGRTAPEGQSVYTKQFGNFIMVKYQAVLSYIIKTITRSIIESKTWSVYQEPTTNQPTLLNGIRKIRKAILTIWRVFATYLTIGAKLLKEKSGILYMHSTHSLSSQNHSTASSAENRRSLEAETEVNTAQSVVQVDSTQESGAGNTPTTRRSTIYNVEVEDAHEYFANGCLVSNCHATIYWRVGMSRMTHGQGAILGDTSMPFAQRAEDVSPTGEVIAPDPSEVFKIPYDD